MNLLPVLLKKYWLQLSVTLLIAALAWATEHYRDNAIQYKSQRDTASRSLTLANGTITDMQTRQREVAALDARYTRGQAWYMDMMCEARGAADLYTQSALQRGL